MIRLDGLFLFSKLNVTTSFFDNIAQSITNSVKSISSLGNKGKIGSQTRFLQRSNGQ